MFRTALNVFFISQEALWMLYRFCTSMNSRWQFAHQSMICWAWCKNLCSKSMMNIMAMKWYNSPETKTTEWENKKAREVNVKWTEDMESELGKILIGKSKATFLFIVECFMNNILLFMNWDFPQGIFRISERVFKHNFSATFLCCGSYCN